MLIAFFQGLLTSWDSWLEILVLIVSGLALGAVPALILFRKGQSDDRLVCVLLLGYGLLGLAAPALSLLGALNAVVVVPLAMAGLVAFAFLVRRGAFSSWGRPDFQRSVWIPGLIFIAFLLLRLGFLHGLVLPPFSDSPEHFEKLSELLHLKYIAPFSFTTFLPYYHRGFHGITAWADAVTGNSSPLTMAAAAQFFLALLPVAVYFAVLSFTDRDLRAALFGAVLAGLAWVMPAYAVDFGKYPALVAVCLLPLVLAVFHLTNKAGNTRDWQWWAYLVLISGALVWIHSRIAIFLVIFYATYYLVRFLETRLARNRFETATLLLGLLLVFWILLLDQRNGEGALSFRYYLDVSDHSTFLVLALLPLAFRKYTGLVLQWLLIIALLMLATNAALLSGFYHYPLTLLDQLFFDLLLFLPLTVLGALGMSAAGKLLPAKGSFYRDLFIFLLALVIVNGALIQPWFPSGGSNYVTQDDVRAFSWIQRNTKPTSAFVIASLPKTANYSRPSDSGSWIHLLTGRPVVRIESQYPWDSPASIANLCSDIASTEPVYVYVGHVQSSFSISTCSPGNGLVPVLCYPQAKVLALDCSASSN